MQEGVPVTVRQHGVGTDLTDKHIEGVHVELYSRDVDARFAVEVSDEGMRPAELNEALDDEGVASEDGLVQGESRAAVDAGPPLFKKKVKNVEVEVATCREELEEGTSFVQ